MSYFQSLPELISSNIFERFLNNISTAFIYISRDNIKPFGPLLWSCHDWRSIALCHLFEKQKIKIRRSSICSGVCNWPQDLDQPLESYEGLAKTLILETDLPYDLSFKRDYPDCMFDSLPLSMIHSNARLVEVHIEASSYPNIYIEEDTTQAGIDRMVQYLKQAAPNACDLRIRISASNYDVECNDLLGPTAEFMRSLITNVAKRKLNIYHNMGGCSVDLGSICNVGPLTHIRIKGWTDNWMLEMIRESSETLQLLELDHILAGANFSSLIMDGNDNYMVYPNIRQLLIGMNSGYYTGKPIAKFPGAIPFPNLQRFICPYNYPFGDDVVFRGNQNSLECLNLILTPGIVKDLADNNIFTATSHPKLRQVDIRETYTEKDDYSLGNLRKVVFGMGKNAVDLKLEIDTYGYIQPRHFTQPRLLGQHQLQKLSFVSYPLGIDDLIKVVRSLPNLNELITGYSTHPSQLYDIYDTQSLNQMIDEHYPMGPKLQMLGMLSHFNPIRTEEKWIVLILATLFANVRNLYLPDAYTPDRLIWELGLDDSMEKKEDKVLLARIKGLTAGRTYN